MTMLFDSNTSRTVFSHESLSSMRFKEGTAYPIEQTLTYASPVMWNANFGQCAVLTLTGSSTTISAPTNLVTGAYYAIQVNQDSNGNRTLVWNSIFHFADNNAPMLTSIPLYKDFFTFKYDGSFLCEVGRSQGVA